MKAVSGILIFACTALMVLATPEEVQKLKDARKQAVEECRKENPDVSADDFGAVHKMESPKNEIQHCMINCVYEKMGLVKGGKLVFEEIAKMVQAKVGQDPDIYKIAMEMAQSCRSEVEEKYGSIRKCETPDEFHQCMFRKHSAVRAKPEEP